MTVTNRSTLANEPFRNDVFLVLHQSAGVFHVFGHDAARGIAVAPAKRRHQPCLTVDAVFPQIKIGRVVEMPADRDVGQNAGHEVDEKPEDRIVRVFRQPHVKPERIHMMVALFFQRRCRRRITCDIPLQPLQCMGRQFARERCGEFRFQHFPKLIDVGDAEVLEIEVVPEQGAGPLMGDLPDEEAAARSGFGFNEPLGLEEAHRFTDRPLGHPEHLDHFRFAGQTVAGNHVVFDHQILYRIGNTQRSAPALQVRRRIKLIEFFCGCHMASSVTLSGVGSRVGTFARPSPEYVRLRPALRGDGNPCNKLIMINLGGERKVTDPETETAAWGEAAQERLTGIGACSLQGAGVTRLPFTDEHRRANEVIAAWMHRAGMTVSLDAAGTLVGRFGGKGLTPERVLVLGSHQDSVRNGGRYDGIMGVALACLALEKARSDGFRPDFAVEVHAYADEEGVRFPTALLGPRALAGTFDPAVLEMQDRDGVKLRDALADFGGDPNGITALKRAPGQVVGYLETHIEQGPVLESAGLPVGVVTSICGIERNSATVSGRTGHAGTVPMQGRRDALVAAAGMITETDTRAQAIPDLRATIGTISVAPGAVNQIPETVTMSLEVRSPDDGTRRRFSAEIAEFSRGFATKRGCEAAFERTYEQPAQDCHPAFVERLQTASEEVQGRSLLLPSGATHDASAMADLCPVAMLFVRCRGGVSHVPEEYASAADMGVAVEVLSRFLRAA